MKSKFFFLLFPLLLLGISGFSQKAQILDLFSAKFRLTDHNGNKVSEKTYQNKQVLWVYFGYASCPDVCPITFSRLKTTYDLMKEFKPEVQVLFITVDPKRDTLKSLKSYTSFFNSNFLGLRGTEAETRAAAISFRVVYYETKQKSDAGTLFAHTDRVFLVGKGSLIQNQYDAKTSVDKLAEDTLKLLKK